MEQWERERRDYLNRTLQEGIMYQIGDPPLIAWTGKQGKIDFEISVEKELRKMVADYKEKSEE